MKAVSPTWSRSSSEIARRPIPAPLPPKVRRRILSARTAPRRHRSLQLARRRCCSPVVFLQRLHHGGEVEVLGGLESMLARFVIRRSVNWPAGSPARRRLRAAEDRLDACGNSSGRGSGARERRTPARAGRPHWRGTPAHGRSCPEAGRVDPHRFPLIVSGRWRAPSRAWTGVGHGHRHARQRDHPRHSAARRCRDGGGRAIPLGVRSGLRAGGTACRWRPAAGRSPRRSVILTH